MSAGVTRGRYSCTHCPTSNASSHGTAAGKVKEDEKYVWNFAAIAIVNCKSKLSEAGQVKMPKFGLRIGKARREQSV